MWSDGAIAPTLDYLGSGKGVPLNCEVWHGHIKLHIRGADPMPLTRKPFRFTEHQSAVRAVAHWLSIAMVRTMR